MAGKSIGLGGKAGRAIKGAKYVLRLYVAGTARRSQEAIRSVKSICEDHLAGRYDLRVIDLYKHPALARSEQIVALPTLIKKSPPPLRRMIGSMSDVEKILAGLDLRTHAA